MGAYREQLLREESHTALHKEEDAHPFVIFKLKFMICILLFAGFIYLNQTNGSFCHITADAIVEAVTSEDLSSFSNLPFTNWLSGARID